MNRAAPMKQRSVPLSIIPRDDQPDGFIDLDRLFAAVVRRARLVLGFVVLFIMLGAAYLLFTTPLYTSMTSILLDDDLSKYAEEERTPTNSQLLDNQIASAVEILKSGELALRVVDTLKLSENETILNPPRSPVAIVMGWVKSAADVFSSGPAVSEEAARNGRRLKAAALLQQALNVERVSRSSVVALAYRSSDPQLAATVTRAYADAYLTDQLNANFEATERATVWLQERLDDLRQRSQTAALEVERFRSEKGLTAARGELMSEQQLSDLNSQLIVAQADTASASARYNQYKSIVDQGPEGAVNNATISPKEGDNSVIKELRNRYLTIGKREREVSENFGEDHPQAVSLRGEREDIARQIYQELKQLTASYRNEYEVARSREASLRESIEGITGKNSDASQSLVQLRGLEQKAAALKSLYESYLGRYEQATQQRSFPIAKARVISEAGVPVGPSSPKKTMTLALSAVLGLLVGGAYAAFLEFRERTFRLEGDVRSALGHRSLGYLPLVGSRHKKATELVRARFGSDRPPHEAEETSLPFPRLSRLVVDAPRSAFAETFRNAKLACDHMLPGNESRVIAIASALPDEGKSVVAANFAALLAASGKRTLLIDADIRKPGLTRLITPAPRGGLVEVLTGEATWPAGIKVDQRSKLAILPAGGGTSNERRHQSNELLASPAMAGLIENARNSFDYVVVDLAALAPVVDAKAFAPLADGVLFVVEWGRTPTRLVRDLLNSEPQIDAKVLGVILNKTDMKELQKYSDFDGAEKYRHRYGKYYIEPDVPEARYTAA
ncbi:polysaccharide biosynthesis tyrosine autokinase [Sinorhizobium alkalisoli]|uniref:Chain-length determining protein n=1 Tax=Sinorhizobium alkalisoli TaxID=1752398 RepID=A0A1E3V7X4_9HYPH|nr:polysaccharide biosynthesis tyrosine autokinase [Sinorhizobium alkalisoli]MCG5478973.1 polysaccharide biosynthesis tyrosine autokinase [Sinorhizobium alkalisoli]ODR89547.1 chain-length determining protein [Sinorhizobium alkalisoli]